MGAGWKARINGKRVLMMLKFKIIPYRVLNSTNAKAKEVVEKEKYDNIIIIAERQTRGKGRFSRKWISSSGGLYMTIGLKVKDIDKIKYLTFIAAVSVVRAIRKSGLKALVKWPNDVLVDDKKICGILTETVAGKDNYAFVGIGLNVNQDKFPKNLANKPTSLFLETNKKFSIEKISKTIIKEFNSFYNYYNKRNYKKIINEWKKYSYTLGKKVKVKTLSGTFVGKAVDVDKDCSLVLRLKNGKKKKIVEGDISVV